MATDLTFGSVPPYYREVYDIVCPNQQHVDHDTFVRLLVKSSLPKQTLSQIWEQVDRKQGQLTRTGLYKALALIALAQQGKTITDKLLENYSGDQELPRPSLGELADLRLWSDKVRREKNPNVLGYTYEEIIDFDVVKVELVPEKKGLIIKHVEYEVTSRRYKNTVLRRYNDFNAFYDMMLLKFPYRMIPRLPPKKMMGGDREFIEMRRRSLRRFLNLIVRHPIFCDDPLVKYFFTFTGTDLQHKIKEHFRGTPDEFMTNENALQAKDLVPMDTQLQFQNSREHIELVRTCVSKLRDLAERQVIRSTAYASDMIQLGRELGHLSSFSSPLTAWACGTTTTWEQLKMGFKHLSVEYTSLAEKSSTCASREEEGVVENLSLFLDLLTAYKDLCERQEKGVLNDHQRALSKMGQYKKKKMSATISGAHEADTAERMEQRILEQENNISNIENRNYFSLHCIQMETQLIHANLQELYIALQNMANEQGRAFAELSSVWDHIRPIIDRILQKDIPRSNGQASTSTSPVTSPTADRMSPQFNT